MTQIRFRPLAAAFVLFAATAAAAAQTAPATPPLPAPGATTTIDPNAGLKLTPDQRKMVFDSAMKQRSRIKPPPPEVKAAVGEELPPSLELYLVPDDVAIAIPNTKLYKFTIVRNDVLLVDPTNMRIVDVLSP